MKQFFNEKDRSFFQSTLDKIVNAGEAIGIFFNKKTTWFIKGIIIVGCLILFGSIFFIASFVKNTMNKKK